MIRHRGAAIACAMTCWCANLMAADIETVTVNRAADRYRVTFEVRVDARPEDVWVVVNDFANLAALSPRALESTVLERYASGGVRLKLVLRPCVLVFCRRIRKVSDVYPEAGRALTYSAIAESSDFAEAEERLEIHPDGHGARVSYQADLVPEFFLPPFIGSWLIRRTLQQELLALGEAVENRISRPPR